VVTGLILLLVVSILVFAGTEVLPGDVATAILGREATPDALAVLRDQLDLDAPSYQRYLDWLSGFATGDLGFSPAARQPVASLVDTRFMNSFALAGAALLVLIPLALVLALVAGTRAGEGRDHVISVSSLVLISVPEFVVGTLLIVVFATELGWFPPVSLVPAGASPFDRPAALVLPVATLVAIAVPYMVRMLRAGLIDVMSSEYIHMARLSGIRERRVVFRHALRNALPPTVQVTALTLQWLVGGLIVVETVFSYPGIGQSLVNAVTSRDVPFVQSVSMLIAALYIGINVVADVIVVLLIPKIRTAQ
jgi:peptide/nickel transport system permease protein